MTGTWLTVSAAADQGGISRQAVLKALHGARFKAQRVAGRGARPAQWVIDAESFAHWAARPTGVMSVAEVAAHHGRSPRTVTGWVERGLLPAVEHHGLLWIDRADALHFTPPALGRPRAVTS